MTERDGRTLILDGLRGVAVLAVVAEHAWPELLPGGFAGVDLFFVLSGFLITGILIRELERTNSIDLVGFYARRVRRILPAALLTVLVTAVAFALLLGPAFNRALTEQGLVAALSVSNIYFWQQATDYFAVDATRSPYLHFWSLAVEEQFYLFWPFFLVAVAAAARRLGQGADAMTADRLRRWLPIGVVAIIGASSVILAMTADQVTAFYLLPFRGWELIAGGTVAWLQVRGTGRIVPGPIRTIAVVGGFIALGIVFIFAPKLGTWPGPATVLAVAATACLVAAGDRAPGGRIVANPAMRFFGRISYALYLWHWPLLAAVALMALPATAASEVSRAGAVVAAVIIATVSTLAFEEPIRASRIRALGRRRVLGVAIVAVAGVALLIGNVIPTLGRMTDGEAALASAIRIARGDRGRVLADHCASQESFDGALIGCAYGTAAASDGGPTRDAITEQPVVVLFGDSHALDWFPAVDDWARARGTVLVPLIRGGCSMIAEPRYTATGCAHWRANALAEIERLRPEATIVALSFNSLRNESGLVNLRTKPSALVEPLRGLLDDLRADSRTVALLSDVPRPGFTVPDCFAVHRFDPLACARPLDEVDPPALRDAEQAAASGAGVGFVDVGGWLCPDSLCTWRFGDRLGWLDDNHITASASRAIAEPLARALDTIAATGSQPD